MKPRTGLTLVALLFVAGGAGAADQTLLPAYVCQHNSAPLLKPGYQGQLWNDDSAEAHYIHCALGHDGSLDVNDDILIYFDDNNANNADDAHFSCGAVAADEDWETVVSVSQKWGCATVGGCATAPGIYASEGHVRLDNVQHGGAMSAYVVCVIPKKPGGASTASFARSIVHHEQ